MVLTLACSLAPQDEPGRRVEEGDAGTSHAQRIVKELYVRYQKQLQRWRDYRNLFVFLAFVALFLAVLYEQRQANISYKVHATLTDVLVPESDVLGSTDDVYGWLRDLLTVSAACFRLQASACGCTACRTGAGGLQLPDARAMLLHSSTHAELVHTMPLTCRTSG